MMNFVALIAVMLYATSLMILAFLHTRYRNHNILRDPVSDYGVGNSKIWFQVNGFVGAVGAVLVAWLFNQTGLFVWISTCLVLSAVARIGVVMVPTDIEGQPKTWAGRFHLLLAIASFALLYSVVDNATPVLAARNLGAAQSALIVLRWIAAGSLAAVVCCLILRPLRGYFGLAERIFLIAIPSWVICAILTVTII